MYVYVYMKYIHSHTHTHTHMHACMRTYIHNTYIHTHTHAPATIHPSIQPHTAAPDSPADGYAATPAALFDLVDVTRQVLSDCFARLFVELAGFVHVRTGLGLALPTGGIDSVSHAEERMQLLLGIIEDLDALLATQV